MSNPEQGVIQSGIVSDAWEPVGGLSELGKALLRGKLWFQVSPGLFLSPKMRFWGNPNFLVPSVPLEYLLSCVSECTWRWTPP